MMKSISILMISVLVAGLAGIPASAQSLSEGAPAGAAPMIGGITIPSEVGEVLDQFGQGLDDLLETGRDIYHGIYGGYYDYKLDKTQLEEMTRSYKEHPSSTLLLFLDRCQKGVGINASKLYFGLSQSRDFGTLMMVDRQGVTTVYTGPIAQEAEGDLLTVTDVITGDTASVAVSTNIYGDYRLETISGFGALDGNTYTMEKAYSAELAVAVAFASNYPEEMADALAAEQVPGGNDETETDHAGENSVLF